MQIGEGERSIFRKRCRRWNHPGQAHFLTFSCFRRMPLLSRDRARVWMCAAIADACNCHGFHLWAYVIMPEHVHVLIVPTRKPYSVSSWLVTSKRGVARPALNWLRGNSPTFLEQLADVSPQGKRSFRFWQRGGGYDVNLVETAATWDTINYIHWNPVRRGLCRVPSEWKWSSASVFAGER